MKHLFYFVCLMLLWAGCSGEDDPQSDLFVTTRMGVNDVHLTLSDHTMYISWNKPFGDGMGISVEVYDQSSALSSSCLGSFFSKNDCGQSSFSMSSAYYTYPSTLPLIAKVTLVPSSGSSSMVMNVPINNTNPEYTPIALCNHSYTPQNPNLRIELNENLSTLDFYTNLSTLGNLVYKLQIQGYYRDSDGILRYGNEESMSSTSLYSLEENREFQARFHLQNMEKFANSSDAYVYLEVRIHDKSCRNAYYPVNNGMFPKCTNYCKYEFAAVPLSMVNRVVSMNIVRDTNPDWH